MELLDEVSDILIKLKERLSTTGEGFNIFKVIHTQHKELVHSSMIAELLNPRGSHMQRDVFLTFFLEECKIQKKFDLDSIRIMQEVSQNVDGRIDILIQDKNNNFIIIENKIWAREQYRQIDRYTNSFPQACILYLTPYGHKPSEYSMTCVQQNLKCISYKKDILNWLNKCLDFLKENKVDLLYQNLLQYKTIIMDITNTNFENARNNIVNKILSNEDSFDSFLAIKEAIPTLREKVFEGFCNKLKKIADELKLTLITPNPNNASSQYSSFLALNDTLLKLNICLCLQFQSSDFQNPCVGIAFYGTGGVPQENTIDLSPLSDRFKKAFHDYNIEGQNTWWIASMYLKTKSDWNFDLMARIEIKNNQDDNYLTEIRDFFEKTVSIMKECGLTE